MASRAAVAVPRSRGPQEVANSPQHKTFTNPFFQSGPGTLFNNLVFEVDDQDSQAYAALPDEGEEPMFNEEGTSESEFPDESDTDESVSEAWSESEEEEEEGGQEVPPRVAPFITWSVAEGRVQECPKAELLPPADLEVFARRSARLNPRNPTAGVTTGVVDVVRDGRLVGSARQFPTDEGLYVILVAPPTDPGLQRRGMSCPIMWSPVYIGKAEGTARSGGLRQRMGAYIHPRSGTFCPSHTDSAFKYHALRALQARGFAIQVRYFVFENEKSRAVEGHLLHLVDPPLNYQLKQTRKYRAPEVPCLVEDAQHGRMVWVRRALADFPVLYRMPAPHARAGDPAAGDPALPGCNMPTQAQAGGGGGGAGAAVALHSPHQTRPAAQLRAPPSPGTPRLQPAAHLQRPASSAASSPRVPAAAAPVVGGTPPHTPRPASAQRLVQVPGLGQHQVRRLRELSALLAGPTKQHVRVADRQEVLRWMGWLRGRGRDVDRGDEVQACMSHGRYLTRAQRNRAQQVVDTALAIAAA